MIHKFRIQFELWQLNIRCQVCNNTNINKIRFWWQQNLNQTLGSQITKKISPQESIICKRYNVKSQLRLEGKNIYHKRSPPLSQIEQTESNKSASSSSDSFPLVSLTSSTSSSSAINDCLTSDAPNVPCTKKSQIRKS